MPSHGLNVFSGPDSIRQFLDPENSPATPLVELPSSINPHRQDAVRIFAKLCYLTPLLNIKHLPVFNMLREAEKSGRLDGVHTIVENSSGNAGFSLAVMARTFGIRRVIAYVPFDIAPGKLDMLRLVGVQPELTRGAPDEPSGIQQAKEAGSKPGFFSLSQYENENNPGAYEKWLAPEIWRQTEGKITVFSAGLGATGTILGAARYFRGCPREVTVVSAMCAPAEAVPGRPFRSQTQGSRLRLGFRSSRDHGSQGKSLLQGEPGALSIGDHGRPQLRLRAGRSISISRVASIQLRTRPAAK
jgi:cysteine synthase